MQSERRVVRVTLECSAAKRPCRPICGSCLVVHLADHLCLCPSIPAAMARRRSGVTLSLVVLGLILAITVPLVVFFRHHAPCGPRAFVHAAVAADSKVCSDIGRAILQQHGSPTDAAIAALVCTSVVNPQSMGLGGGVIFTIYNATTGKTEVVNARETVPARTAPGLLNHCEQAQPLGTGTRWIGVPGELRGYAEAHRRHGRLPWARLFQPTIELLKGAYQVPPVLGQFLNSTFLRPFLLASSLRQLFFNGTEPLRAGNPLLWPALVKTLETVAAEGAEAFYTGELAHRLVEDIAKEGFNFSAESAARPEGRVSMYHHLVETLKFAWGQRWRLWDPQSHPEAQNVSLDLLGDALAQSVLQQIDPRGDHPLSHYGLAGARGLQTGTAHVSVLGEDGSAVAATSTINTPFGAMVYSPQTGILLNNELLDLCWRHRPGPGETPPPVPGEQPPSSMAPSILVHTAQPSTLVIGGAGGELIISAMAQVIMNKLWLGFDLRTAITAPILHVDRMGRVAYEPRFNQEVRSGLRDRGQKETSIPYFLNVVQAVSQEGPCVVAVSDPRKGGEAAGY
ncbi:glutathione hydrolase 5 proenzyme isoform X2 [Tenrec ecaudatus]|uniref:glutathione hydrolase 5 proenzyme isoform X2 n=1 Tax=Tenrec ecaudatus TaxID=94439 RepID=UPI003F5935F1